MVTMGHALDQMIDHAMAQAMACASDYNALGDALDIILVIARRGGLAGQFADTIEDMTVDNLGVE
ncbi:hypothetical protein SAMN05518849_11846 [Sphingobium sp. AP50]|uniref:hypothetical protein n=1 Tax=Sphingobium sp. AP50 TaxID=1884369 RepID=UPI0008D1928B|nr:hypothetical protein [Sphingobium sp. AP50]SEJ91867.1 hypothetical protein SAMN05518849_11846 [Sphingobium sp. AP50]